MVYCTVREPRRKERLGREGGEGGALAAGSTLRCSWRPSSGPGRNRPRARYLYPSLAFYGKSPPCVSARRFRPSVVLDGLDALDGTTGISDRRYGGRVRLRDGGEERRRRWGCQSWVLQRRFAGLVRLIFDNRLLLRELGSWSHGDSFFTLTKFGR